MTSHPFSTFLLNSLHTFLHFFQLNKESTDNYVTTANGHHNSYLPFQSNSLSVRIKKKKKMRNHLHPGSK